MALLSLVVGCASQAALPPKAVELNEWGAAALEQGDLEAADARLNLALEYNPEFVEAVSNLGLVELQRGNLTRARQLLTRARRLNPDLAQPHHGLGVLAEREYHPDEAQKHYEAALAVDPGFVPARSNLAALFLQAGLYDDALIQYRRLLEVAPESVLGHRGFVEALIGERRFDEAWTITNAGLELFPEDPSLTISLARLELQAGRGEHAKALLLPLAEREDDHAAEARAWLAVEALAHGDAPTAIGMARASLALVPDHPLGNYALAVGLDTVNAPEATEWLQQAIRLNPNNPELTARLGEK